jgi:diacylglycerol kinase
MTKPVKKKRNFFVSRYHSFGYAFHGFKILFTEEVNARIHVVGAVVVIAMGFWLDVSAAEWLVLSIVMGLVFAFEIMNTAIENLADYVSPSKQYTIKKVKDLGAAGVLASVFMAVATGLIIFIPKILAMLK